ncbi:MAG: hypothetical protein GEU92_05875 [Alphaproteobacteria bacterium]|nr:hypothetical protein [Alphaproteobacteria bacterium]
MTLIKPLVTAALIAAPALMEGPGVFPVSAAGVVVTYANNTSSVVVSPAPLVDRAVGRTPDGAAEPPPLSGVGADALRDGAARDGAAEPPPPRSDADACEGPQNCGSIAPPM